MVGGEGARYSTDDDHFLVVGHERTYRPYFEESGSNTGLSKILGWIYKRGKKGGRGFYRWPEAAESTTQFEREGIVNVGDPLSTDK